MERKINFAVGLFMLAGIACLGYLSLSFGNVDFFAARGYAVKAVFSNVTGLKVNTSVEMLGIKVGKVTAIDLKDYKAIVTMQIDRQVDLPEDTIASVRTRGLLGEQYVALSPGGLPDLVRKDGTGEIVETQPPLIMEEMIGKMMFGSSDKKEKTQ
ncbi:outer membrane lipid asymmetry maintenance protein MlaD [bacterium]|nr:outer membrane lipid asymmetry maintenance protein MlaD [bacterium]